MNPPTAAPPTAAQLVVAMNSTTNRYLSGYMVKATWRKHMRAIWARVAELKLEREVCALILKVVR